MGRAELLDAGWAGLYDESDNMGAIALGALGALGGPSVDVGMAPPATPGYPVSGDPRQRSSAAQIATDAATLRELGYPAPSTGNAYDPRFTAEVAQFQRDVSPRAGVVDGLIGPATRSVMALELDKRRASKADPFGPIAPPAPPFTPSASPLPGAPASPSPSPSPAVTPAVAKDEDNTTTYVAAGLGVAAAIGLLWYATR